MKISKFGRLLEKTYTDRLSINRHTEITNADGTSGIGLPTTPKYSDIPCRISFNQTDNPESNKDDTNPIFLRVKLFCNPYVDIVKGDILIADRIDDDGNIMETYKGTANLPLKYTTHQEVLFAKVGDA